MNNSELSRDIAMGLLFSGLVDNFRSDQVAEFCNQMAAYLIRKYDIVECEVVQVASRNEQLNLW